MVTRPQRNRGKAAPYSILILLLFIIYIPLSVWVYRISSHSQSDDESVSRSSLGAVSETSSKVMQDMEENMRRMEDRVSYLEIKLNAYLSFNVDPFRGMTAVSDLCKKHTDLSENCPKKKKRKDECPEMDHELCLDNFPPSKPQPCIVYDFGIRANPEFGEYLSLRPYSCDVFAFDPSPITRTWYETRKDLHASERYHLYDYGAGGINGNIILREYNWGQISIYQYPEEVVDKTNCTEKTCELKEFGTQTTHEVPVRTLKSIMTEMGHERVSALKIDIEGSEYPFLEAMIDDGSCRFVDQMSLEWHHHDYDSRYGTSSSPHINMLVALLEERCGLHLFWVWDSSGGWLNRDKIYADMEISLRYNLVSFVRKKEAGAKTEPL